MVKSQKLTFYFNFSERGRGQLRRECSTTNSGKTFFFSNLKDMTEVNSMNECNDAEMEEEISETQTTTQLTRYKLALSLWIFGSRNLDCKLVYLSVVIQSIYRVSRIKFSYLKEVLL